MIQEGEGVLRRVPLLLIQACCSEWPSGQGPSPGAVRGEGLR